MNNTNYKRFKRLTAMERKAQSEFLKNPTAMNARKLNAITKKIKKLIDENI